MSKNSILADISLVLNFFQSNDRCSTSDAPREQEPEKEKVGAQDLEPITHKEDLFWQENK